MKDSTCNMPQINLREQHLSCRKWWMRMMSAAIVSLLCVVFMDHQTQAQMKYTVNPLMQHRYSGYRSPEEIFEVFRDRKVRPYGSYSIALNENICLFEIQRIAAEHSSALDQIGHLSFLPPPSIYFFSGRRSFV